MKPITVPLISVVLLLFVSPTSSISWKDCGTPLAREICYQDVTLSHSLINNNVAGTQISVNINAILQTSISPGAQVNLQVIKDGATYLRVSAGDLCSILLSQNQIACPVPPGTYSLSYIYQLPPLPSGDYTVQITTFDQFSSEIGCLSVETTVTGLEAQSCTYTSTLSAQLSGSVFFYNNSIQVGPWGPDGENLGYPWGTFQSVKASADLVGSSPVNYNNYVWGITGALNASKSGTVFEGTAVIGYLPNPNIASGAILVQQGYFSWQTLQSGNPPFVLQSSTINFSPKYAYPSGFPYPLALGNLNPFQITPSTDATLFAVSASRTWCTCNCALVSGDPSSESKIQAGSGASGNAGTMNWKLGTIIVAAVGGTILIISLAVLYRLYQNPIKPPVYDDADMMDPQKPDYGSIAINEIFEDDERRDYL